MFRAEKCRRSQLLVMLHVFFLPPERQMVLLIYPFNPIMVVSIYFGRLAFSSRLQGDIHILDGRMFSRGELW